MYAALEKVVRPETVSGVECEACGQRCDHVKRTCLSDRLPRVVVVNLQRFAMNYETFVTEKVSRTKTNAHFLRNLIRLSQTLLKHLLPVSSSLIYAETHLIPTPIAHPPCPFL